jgi:hypothetical protein
VLPPEAPVGAAGDAAGAVPPPPLAGADGRAIWPEALASTIRPTPPTATVISPREAVATEEPSAAVLL